MRCTNRRIRKMACLAHRRCVTARWAVVAGGHSQLVAGATNHQEGLWAELRGDNAVAGRRAEQREEAVRRTDGCLRWDRHHAHPQEHGARLRQSQMVAGTTWSYHGPDEWVSATWSSVRRNTMLAVSAYQSLFSFAVVEYTIKVDSHMFTSSKLLPICTSKREASTRCIH